MHERILSPSLLLTDGRSEPQMEHSTDPPNANWDLFCNKSARMYYKRHQPARGTIGHYNNLTEWREKKTTTTRRIGWKRNGKSNLTINKSSIVLLCPTARLWKADIRRLVNFRRISPLNGRASTGDA